MKLKNIPSEFYGEGIIILNDKIYQLTYQDHICFVYNLNDFTLINQFELPTEGWGMTTDQHHLMISDGTSNLYFYDPIHFKEAKRITVKAMEKPIEWINELEYVKGYIYANVLYKDGIAIISPYDGQIQEWIDLSKLIDIPKRNLRLHVLNGIAYDEQNDLFYLTGKLFPYIFEVKMKPI